MRFGVLRMDERMGDLPGLPSLSWRLNIFLFALACHSPRARLKCDIAEQSVDFGDSGLRP
jgi:hypothetical protein